MKLKGKIAVVTGAGSGIGRALAINLAKQGTRLALNDFNHSTLEETSKLITDQGFELPFLVSFDVAKREEMFKFAQKVASHFGQIDIMINNAGVALGRVSCEEITQKDFEWVMGINFWGMVHGSQAFLPYLKKRPEASLVNISSLFGLIGIAYQGAYCTSKFAIRGYTESLRMEMLDQVPHVNVITVHPGGIKTGIARNSKLAEGQEDPNHAKDSADFERKFFKTTPDQAAEVILLGIKKNKGRVLIGRDAKTSSLLARILPSKYINIVGKAMKKNGLT